ncbi:MAG TPA: hypothetical protein VN686_09795 [Gaiellales bacterium]|nr:hypothetical protein [Gaiellales bacterium]
MEPIIQMRITAQYADLERVRPARRGPPQVSGAGRALPPAGARSGRDRALDRRVQRRADHALDDYLAAGVTHFIMGVGGPDWDIGQLSKLIVYRDQHNGG